MNKEQKAQVIEELSSKFAASAYFYIADASCLSVAQTNEFRRKCFEAGIDYKVYKNTLIQKALERANIASDELSGVLKGFSGVLFTTEEAASKPAKIIKDFRQKDDKPAMKAAYIDSGVFVGDNNLTAMTQLKTKNELIGDIVGLLQSPAKNVVSALTSGGSKLAGILQTLSEKSE